MKCCFGSDFRDGKCVNCGTPLNSPGQCKRRYDDNGDHKYGYRCTLPTGHTGNHKAHGPDGKRSFGWPDGWGEDYTSYLVRKSCEYSAVVEATSKEEALEYADNISNHEWDEAWSPLEIDEDYNA